MFDKRLIQLRKQRDLSQYALAERLNMTRGQIANYEQGKRQPDFETLEKIADFFDVSTDYLMGRVDVPYGVLTDAERQLVSDISSMSDEEILNKFKFTFGEKPISPSNEDKLKLVIQMIRLDETQRRAK